MPLKIQLRHDTAANWAAADPVLMAGEVGVDLDTGQIKIGDGATAWTELDYALTGPTGPAGPLALALTGPPLVIAAGVPLQMQITRDSYIAYSVVAATGVATLDGDIITYTGVAIGADTLTITAGDATRELAITVIANTLGTAPAAPPSIAAAYAGGFYAGAIWDTVTTATGAVTVAASGAVTITIPPADLGRFYLGQEVRLATTDSRQAVMTATVLAGADDQLSLTLSGILVGTAGASYAGWVLAARWALIGAPRSGGVSTELDYKTANTADPAACRTLTNGPAATAAMEAANTDPANPLYPAARWVAALNAAGGLNGYTDWYIPARDELELLFRHWKPYAAAILATTTRFNAGAYYTRDANLADITTNNGENRHSAPAGAAYPTNLAQCAVAAFQTAGAEALLVATTRYWSSSEADSIAAWEAYNVSSGSAYGTQNNVAKNYSGCVVRAVRREIF